MHNRVGYQRLRPADPPADLDVVDGLTPIPPGGFPLAPGVTDAGGVVAGTRAELAAPVNLGPFKFVPNVRGEVTHYGEAIDGDDLTRLVGGGGVRASLPMWRADPNVSSALLNINGLAHKVDFLAEYSFEDSDTNLGDVPLYDPLDDIAQMEFRRRFTFDTFGGLLPPEFDRRTFYYRQGYQDRVAGGSDDIVDDLNIFRLGVHQRFQTKRGLPGVQRIVDVYEFDVDTILFADPDDNFGETFGPTTYRSAYHLGDRVSLVSDGYIDWFDDGLEAFSAGVQSSRPGRGDAYVGLLKLDGPGTLDSTALTTRFNYRLNEKWIASLASTYDFGNTGNIGQSAGLTRIGESFLVRLGINVDEGRDNVGFRFSLEPRFLPRPKLGRLGGEFIPPPGIGGLE